MKQIESVQLEWEKDNKVGASIETDLRNIGLLQSKYLRWMMEVKAKLSVKDIAMANMKRDLTYYYKGQASEELLKQLGKQQYELKANEKQTHIDHAINSDKCMAELKAKYIQYEDLKYLLDEILTSINFRTNRLWAVMKARAYESNGDILH